MLFLTNRVKHDFLETCAQIQVGSLRLRTPEGEVYDFGIGSPAAEMQIFDWSVITTCAARGDTGLGDTYVAGLWETPSIAILAEVALKNRDNFRGYTHAVFWSRLKFQIVNRLMRARARPGTAHPTLARCDVGNEFYQNLLDETMSYSSAMFTPNDRDLLRAQNRKYDRVLSRLEGSERILEIGCGWGGFAERATDTGHQVTGLTTSSGQKGYADARLDGRAEIRLQHYRNCTGQFDSVVSIEMLQSVERKYLPGYFATLKDRLTQNGRAVIQAIIVPDNGLDPYRNGSGSFQNGISPSGTVLSNNVISDQARRVGLKITDTFAFGADYAQTCASWNTQLIQNAGRIRRLGFDESLLRNWRFYLGICTASFSVGQSDVVQIELTHA